VSAAHGQLSLPFMGTHPPILLGTLGMWDSFILMVLALVVFGPRRLPQIGRQVGKLMYEFRKASNDFKFQMEEELRNTEEADRRKKEEERQRSLAASVAAEQASVSADPRAPAKPVESPSPGDEQPSPPSVGAARSEEEAPRILPPTMGETVAAARPGQGSDYYSEAPNGQESAQHTERAEQAGSNEPGSSLAQNTAEALNQHG
jgi:sec-independent protein translocase protein TatB